MKRPKRSKKEKNKICWTKNVIKWIENERNTIYRLYCSLAINRISTRDIGPIVAIILILWKMSKPIGVSKWRKIKMTTIWPFPIFITEDKWTHQKSNEWRMSDRTMCSSSKLTDQRSNLNNTQSMSEGIQAILLLIGKNNKCCHGFRRRSFTHSPNLRRILTSTCHP